MKTGLPVGFRRFHRNKFFNYQLNRWYSLGYVRLEDMEKAALQIRNFKDYTRVFLALAEEAEAEGRGKNAAFYYRAAEFLMKPSDPEKIPVYKKFIQVFYSAFEDENIERYTIPYENGYLPAVRLSGGEYPKGTIIVFGGFDSFIEEWYAILKNLSLGGYEVIAFEGPGQGGALRLYGIVSDHAWEKPVKTVLDYFDRQDVTILGISMGGYWCLRAAAFEKRISRVIAFPPLYDWMVTAGSSTRKLVTAMMKRERLMRASIRMKMRSPLMEHVVNNTLFITGKEDLLDVVRWELAMNAEFLHSELVDQDVLLLAGEKDAFQPPVMYERQKEALTNARSVTGRMFSAAEHAENHCAVGNLGLAISVMLEWLQAGS